MQSCGIRLRVISQEMLKIYILDMDLEITNSRLQPHLPAANELTYWDQGKIFRLIFSNKNFQLRLSSSMNGSVRPSVRPSVCPSHLFDYVPIIVSSRNFQELLPMTEVMPMQ